MSTVTLPILVAIDELIAKATKRHPGIPDVTVVLGAAGHTKKRQVHGHFYPDSWKSTAENEPLAHEILLSGESLKRGATETLGTLLHELAHAYAHAKDIKDTSNGNRYHNKKFKEIGNEFGLELEQHDTIGWSITTVPEATAEYYKEGLAKLEKALVRYRIPNGQVLAKPAKKFQMECPECLDPVTVTKKWFAANEFKVRCAEHDEAYELVEVLS